MEKEQALGRLLYEDSKMGIGVLAVPVVARLNRVRLYGTYGLLALLAFAVIGLLGLALSREREITQTLLLGVVVAMAPLLAVIVHYQRGPKSVEVQVESVRLAYKGGHREIPFSSIARIYIGGNPSGGLHLRLHDGKTVVFPTSCGRGSPVGDALVQAVCEWGKRALGATNIRVRDVRVLGSPDLEIVLVRRESATHEEVV